MAPASYTIDEARGLTAWDLPGQNDDCTYLTTELISLINGLSFIGIMVEHTISEMSSIISLLQDLGLPYYIIVNKIDRLSATSDELGNFKSRISADASHLGDCFKGIFFVSSKELMVGDDWVLLMDKITGE